VEHDERPAHPEGLGEFADGRGAGCLEPLEDAPALRLGEDAERVEIVVPRHAVSLPGFRQQVLTQPPQPSINNFCWQNTERSRAMCQECGCDTTTKDDATTTSRS
jgi:hypothetical protein